MKGINYYTCVRYTDEETRQLRLVTRWDLCKLRRRAKGNMTQEEYAEWCGVSVAVIRRLESREPYNPAWRSEKFEKILGVTMDFAFDHVEWPCERSKRS
ncbi:ribosome-binding protein aMBF1 (putative translation factor) [Bacillus sp. 3255]|nr:ribosome-binding protein aMBF1 (putative translation factor) [Bacillus sp. 3255]